MPTLTIGHVCGDREPFIFFRSLSTGHRQLVARLLAALLAVGAPLLVGRPVLVFLAAAAVVALVALLQLLVEPLAAAGDLHRCPRSLLMTKPAK